MDLRLQVKELIVSALQLEGVLPAEIQDEGRLFGGGLGLDSVDALELAIRIEETFGVRMPEDDRAKQAFSTVSAIATYIEENR